MTTPELSEKLKKRLEAVEGEAPAKTIDSQVLGSGRDRLQSNGLDTDLASLLSKRRERSDQGLTWESEPAAHSADFTAPLPPDFQALSGTPSQPNPETVKDAAQVLPEEAGEKEKADETGEAEEAGEVLPAEDVSDDEDEDVDEEAGAEAVADAVAQAAANLEASDADEALDVLEDVEPAPTAGAEGAAAATAAAPAPKVPGKKRQASKAKAKAKAEAKAAAPDSPALSEEDHDDSGSDATDDHTEAASTARGEHKVNRAEKKSRKAVQKLGMRTVPGILRVTIKKSKNVLFVIAQPEVYKAPGSDTYIVFGDCKIEDLSAQAQASAAKQLAAAGGSGAASLGNTAATTASLEECSVEEVVDEEDGEVDESGVAAADIDLVISQASCSRSKAVRALKANNNDIVEAIMALSSG
mmetsp:Transcript_74596/g.136200  ORF Transcript_74596/g.136200 Transcript_74596/m.136200 type:complete len:413 (+) Transcript_74596:141-1379(+)